MFGGLPNFPENDNQEFGAEYRFGGGYPFFSSKNWSSGIGIGYQFGVVVSVISWNDLIT